MPRLVIDVSAEPLARVLRHSMETGPLLNRIGSYVASQFQARFKQQPWPERRVPNVGAIVRYLSRGQVRPDLPERYFQSRPVLQDTGRLRQSITHRLDSSKSVAIGTNVAYGRRQLLGLPESMAGGGPGGDPSVRAGARYLLARTSDPTHASALEWILAQDLITITPLARDFLKVDKPLLARLTKIIEQWIEDRAKEG